MTWEVNNSGQVISWATLDKKLGIDSIPKFDEQNIQEKDVHMRHFIAQSAQNILEQSHCNNSHV